MAEEISTTRSERLSDLEKEIITELRSYLDLVERFSREPSMIKVDSNIAAKRISSKLNNKYQNSIKRGESFKGTVKGIIISYLPTFNYERNGKEYLFQLTNHGIEEVSERDWIIYARKRLVELGYKE